MCGEARMMDNTVGHSIDCAGTADFIRDFGIDLARMLENAFGEEARGSDDVPDPSLVGPQPRADLVTPMLVGFVAYLFSWTAKTFLDEVYQLKLQPRVREWLVAADERVLGTWRKRKKTFTVSAWYEDLGVIVTVALQASSFSRIAEESERILALHRFGLDWAVDHPEAAPVQMYVVSNGVVDVEPRLFRTTQEAHDSFNT
jgi:hypothetical protein